MPLTVSQIKKRRAEKKKIGVLGYVVSALSFIPLIGVFTGVITIAWGIKEWHKGGKKMVIISMIGILLMTVGLYSFLFLQLEKDMGGMMEESIETQLLPSLIQSIEYFNLQNGRYSHSLDELAQELPSPLYETEAGDRFFRAPAARVLAVTSGNPGGNRNRR